MPVRMATVSRDDGKCREVAEKLGQLLAAGNEGSPTVDISRKPKHAAVLMTQQ